LKNIQSRQKRRVLKVMDKVGVVVDKTVAIKNKSRTLKWENKRELARPHP
jgi:hypothetical protein